MRLFTYTALAAASLSLTACIDADITATITGADRAEITGYTETQTQMLGMIGGPSEFCDAEMGGTYEARGDLSRCNISLSGNFADIFDGDEDDGPQPTAEDLGNGTVRVTFPFSALAMQMGEVRNDPQTLAMMAPMIQGHTVIVRTAGQEVIESTGEISADGMSASYTLELGDLIDPDVMLPSDFVTVVRY